MKNFRQSHPVRYQPPPSDTESTASRRFNSINATKASGPSNLSNQGSRIVASGDTRSRRHSATSNSLLGLQTKARAGQTY